MASDDRIQPYKHNPRYWQYKGKPVLLLGGSDDDNLFQWTGSRLTHQLDLLKSVRGNYVRCTMSCRDDGNVWPFERVGGKYDLDRWQDEFWRRFATFLELTAERDIIVQIEVWAFHDFNGKHWETSAWRPANNTNYTTANTTLKNRYGNIGRAPHDFFFTVPKLNDDAAVLAYQRKFVDKMLSHTLQYGHVLYCMTNEIHPRYSPEWGWYWATYIKDRAAAAGKQAETSEMYWQPDLKHEQHRPSLDHPEIYSYFEASQNSAIYNGQRNWDNLRFVHGYLAKHPRPINHTKMYGADTCPWPRATDRHATETFWRNVFGGSASSRFHRPPYGLGLSKKAQAHIKSMRMLTDQMDIFTCAPHHGLLSNRKPNEAYCFANPAEECAVYFPDGGEVTLDVSSLGKPAEARWLDISGSRWQNRQPTGPRQSIALRPPGSGHWAVLLSRKRALP